MFILYRITFALARKPNRIKLLFTRKNVNFGAISVTEQSCPTTSLKVERHTSFCAMLWCRVNRYSDRCGSEQVGAGTGIHWDEVNIQERGLAFSSPNPARPTATTGGSLFVNRLVPFPCRCSSWKQLKKWGRMAGRGVDGGVGRKRKVCMSAPRKDIGYSVNVP